MPSPTHSDAVQSVIKFLSLVPEHRARLAKKAQSDPDAPPYTRADAWQEALEAGVVAPVLRPNGPHVGDWAVRIPGQEGWYALELVA